MGPVWQPKAYGIRLCSGCHMKTPKQSEYIGIYKNENPMSDGLHPMVQSKDLMRENNGIRANKETKIHQISFCQFNSHSNSLS